MNKLIIFLLVFMLVPVCSFAANPRNASGVTLTQTTTNLTNLSLTGLNVSGNPGYLAMNGVAVSSLSFIPTYYFWVDATGDLCTASLPIIINNSDFPNGDWQNFPSNHCTKVGSQS